MVAKTWDSSLSLPGLIVDRRAVVDGIVRMSGRLVASHGIYPDCGTLSQSCHSTYDRTLADLPVSGAKVELRLSVRRFRWHLFENASAAFLAAVRSEMPRLRQLLAPAGPVDPATLTRAERLQWDGAQIREALNRQILNLAEQGTPIKAMARTTGVSRQTIRKILRGQRHDIFRSRGSSLDVWSLALEAEWNAGCRVGAELWRRLRTSGFAGSLRVVSEWATRRRRDEKLGHTASTSLSARTIARNMTTERETGSAQTVMINAAIETAVPTLVAARDVLDRFHAMMRSKDEARLDPWIAKAANTKLAAFAAGVEADKDAVAAAISSPWSSGQVEGNVNRLKSIKRQMYGRAKIDLLKERVMAPA